MGTRFPQLLGPAFLWLTLPSARPVPMEQDCGWRGLDLRTAQISSANLGLPWKAPHLQPALVSICLSSGNGPSPGFGVSYREVW